MAYDKSADEADEKDIAEQVALKWGCTAVKLKYYDAQYVLEKDGKIMSWLFIKSRNFASDKFPSTMVSVKKWMGLRTLAHEMGRVAVVMRFSDGIFYAPVGDIPNSPPQLTKKKDDMDAMPVMYIPMKVFRAL